MGAYDRGPADDPYAAETPAQRAARLGSAASTQTDAYARGPAGGPQNGTTAAPPATSTPPPPGAGITPYGPGTPNWAPPATAGVTAPNAPGTGPTGAPATPPASAPGGPGLLGTPGPFEDWAKTHASAFDNPGAVEGLYGGYGTDLLSQKSNAENLYAEGEGALNPYYDYASTIGTKSINDAAAARGGFNSGAAIQGIGNLNANLRGQQARDMVGLASQADQAKLARYGEGFGLAGAEDSAKTGRINSAANLYSDWQDAQQGRLTGGLSSATQLGQDQANAVASFFQSAGVLSNQDFMASINAQLQKAGINPTGDATKDFIALLGVLGKGAAAAGGGG